MGKNIMIGLGLQENVTQGMEDIRQSIDGVSEEAKELQKISERLNKITNSAMPAKKQMRELQSIMANMNLKGLSNTDEFTAVAQRAGELKDAMSDAQQAVNAYANDVFNLKAAGDVFTGIAAAGSIATGVTAMFGVENEKVQQILLKVQAAQAILNGVTAISNVLNKDSALMLKIKEIRMKVSTATTRADTVATVANTTAEKISNATTKQGTIIQTAWNTAKAIGKAMVGDFTGLLLLGIGAVATYAAVTASSTEDIKENTSALGLNAKELEIVKEKESTYANSTASEFAKTMKAYDDLRDSWNKLKSAKEKNQFLKDNKTKIQELTTAIQDIDSAEQVFNDKTGNVVKAFKLRAQAAAAAAVQIEMYKRAMEAEMNMQFGMRGTVINETNFKRLPKNIQDQLQVNKTERRVVGTKYNPSPDGGYRSNEYAEVPIEWKIPDNASEELLSQLKAAGAYAKGQYQQYQQAMAQADWADKKHDELMEVANKLLAEGTKGGSGGGTKGGNNNKSEKQIKSLEEAIEAYKKFDKEIKKVQDDIAAGWMTPEAGEQSIATFKAAQKKILDEWSPKGMMVPVTAELDENSIKYISDKIKELEDKRAKINVDSDDFVELTRQIEQWSHKKIQIETTINKAEIDKQLNEIEFKPKLTSFELAIGADQYDYTKFKTDDIDARINAIQNMMNYNDSLITQLNTLKETYELMGDAGAEGLGKVQTAIEKVTKSQEELTQKAREYNQQQQTNQQTAEKLDTLSESLSVAASAVNDLGNAFTNLGKIADNSELQVAGIIAQAIATMIQSYTTAAAQAAKLGPWVWAGFAVSGLAQVTSVVAQLKSLSKYAGGGVINGSTTLGDHVLARVNGGEMILNTRQQSNLFRMIDEGRASTAGQVQVVADFKLKGSDIYGSLKNLNKVNNGVGKNIGIR